MSACSSVVSVLSQSGELAAEPQVDAALVNEAEMKVSHLSQFAFTDSVHPVRACLRSSSLQLCISIWRIIRSILKLNLQLISGSDNVPNHRSASFSYNTVWSTAN